MAFDTLRPLAVRSLARRLLSGTPSAAPQWKWDVEPTDIYLVSFPRSGNTWMRYLLTNLRFPDREWSLPEISVAFPEIGSAVDPSTVPRPRWIKSHASHDPRYRKVVHLVRDPRAVAVSFYHWSGTNRTDSFDAFVREKIIASGDGWQAHVEGWGLDQTDDKIVVRYEDLLHGDGELQRMCSFLGMERSHAEINQARARSSVYRQQADFDKHPALRGKKVGVSRDDKDWHDYFTDELLDEFWAAAGDTMTKAGYKKESVRHPDRDSKSFDD